MRKKLIFLFLGVFTAISFSKTHKVRAGDNLEIISRKYNISVSQLMVRNQLPSSNIKQGELLDVGGDGYHIVVYGESISKIARRYNLKPSKLIDLNNLRGKNIHPGQKIKIRSTSKVTEKLPRKAPEKNLAYNGHNYFSIKEFVDKETYQKFGAKSVWFIDNDLIAQMNQLRELFGRRITINTWANGGRFQWRGFRTPDSPVYTKYSSHSFGRAVDFDVEGLSAAQARKQIIQWYREGILTSKSINLEVEVSWVHLDIRNGEGLRTFRP